MKQKESNKWILLLIMFAFSVVLGGSMLIMFYFYETLPDSQNTREYDQHYVMIVEDRKSDYWKAIYKSAYEKGQEMNVYVDLMGENLLQDYSKEELMEMAIASEVDGIILAADESEELTKLIDEAVQNNIMVVTVQGDNSQSTRCSYVSVGNYNLGIEYGNQIIDIAREKAIEESKSKEAGHYNPSGYYLTGPSKIDVTVLVDASDSSQNIIRSAIQETVEAETAVDVSITFTPVDTQYEFAEEEAIRDIFMNTKQPDVIVCLSEQSTVCAYQTVVDYNKVGQVNILGYYVSNSILNAIDRGVVYATMAVDTEQMGGYCVEALYEYSVMGNTSQYFTAGTSLVNKYNVASYMGGEKNEK